MTTQKLTNNENLPLSIAVWLAEDNYQHSSDPFEVSATTLIKPLRQIIMGSRVPVGSSDITSYIASRMGTAYHDAIEAAWKNNPQALLEKLGYAPGLIKQLVVNPETLEEAKDKIAVYLEKRTKKKLGKWTISGQYDFVGNGKLEDFKSTGVYTYMKKTKDEDYRLQGSIYRWLNPEIITKDVMDIQFIFTDWAAKDSRQPGYPPRRIVSYPLELLPLQQTENFIQRKLDALEHYWNAADADIPECTSEELWQRDSVWKYYKNGNTAGRSTKNFDNVVDAHSYKSLQGKGMGVVKEVKGLAKACHYCNGFTACQQKDRLIQAKMLEV